MLPFRVPRSMSAPSRNVSAWLLAILLPLTGYLSWHHYSVAADSGSAPGASNRDRSFVTEEQWLVDETARDITEMLVFARNGRTDALEVITTPDAGMPQSYAIRAKFPEGHVEATLQWKDFIWSPAEYAPWVEKMLATLKLAPATPATNETAILEALTSPTPQKLREESKRLSEALTQSPLNAGLHDQAALVTAAFALREAASYFSDTRREICRIAAHLAIARTLQPHSTSPVHQFAEAALETLAGREAIALTQLAELEGDKTPGAAAWVRALRLRNSTDWRQAAPEPTLFEEREIFLARTRDVGNDFAVQWLGSRQAALVDDWRRIVLEDRFSVERGHQHASDSVAQEMNSLQADWAMFFGGKLPDGDLAKAFDAPPARSVTKGADGREVISVLGWDLWSAQHERHLCQSVHVTIVFLRDLWGVPQYRDMQLFVQKTFAGLRLFPTVERDLTEDPGDAPKISQRVAQLLADHPIAVPPAVWGRLRLPTEAFPALAIGAPEGWLAPPLPFGTTYDICFRQESIHLPGASDTAWWDRLVRIAPHNYDVLATMLWTRHGNKTPVEIAEATYAPIKDFNLGALRKMAKAEEGHSPQYLDTMQRICALNPEHYFELGDYYRSQNQPEPAAAAYLKGVELSPDRVMVSNSCDWLVEYLDDHGQSAKAFSIAGTAAAVYSAAGLETMAKLSEKHGRFEEAEDYFKKIADRVRRQSATRSFLRPPEKLHRRAGRLRRNREKKGFLNSLTKVTLADFKGTAGRRSAADLGLPQFCGGRTGSGDDIVALDGYRVHTSAQVHPSQRHVRRSENAIDRLECKRLSRGLGTSSRSTFRHDAAQLPQRNVRPTYSLRSSATPASVSRVTRARVRALLSARRRWR